MVYNSRQCKNIVRTRKVLDLIRIQKRKRIIRRVQGRKRAWRRTCGAPWRGRNRVQWNPTRRMKGWKRRRSQPLESGDRAVLENRRQPLRSPLVYLLSVWLLLQVWFSFLLPALCRFKSRDYTAFTRERFSVRTNRRKSKRPLRMVFFFKKKNLINKLYYITFNQPVALAEWLRRLPAK